jgi:hypothetical protein
MFTDDKLIGMSVFQHHLIVGRYLNFLEIHLPEIQEDMTLESDGVVRQSAWEDV